MSPPVVTDTYAKFMTFSLHPCLQVDALTKFKEHSPETSPKLASENGTEAQGQTTDLARDKQNRVTSY